MVQSQEIKDAVKKCNPQKSIIALANVMDGFESGITNAQKTADTALSAANEAGSKAENAVTTANEAKTAADNAVNNLESSSNSSTVTVTGTKAGSAPTETPLPVVSTTVAGVLNASDYKFFQEYDARLRAVEGISKTYLVTLPSDNPSTIQITTAYTTAYPDAPNPPLEGTVVIDPARENLSYRWNTVSSTWYRISNVAVNQFTNTTLGTIKGSTNDGEIQANSDGTGAVTGWDTLKTIVQENRIRSIGDIRIIQGAVGQPPLFQIISPDDYLVGDVIFPLVNSLNKAGMLLPEDYAAFKAGTRTYKETIFQYTRPTSATTKNYTIDFIAKNAPDVNLGKIQLGRNNNKTMTIKYLWGAGNGQNGASFISVLPHYGKDSYSGCSYCKIQESSNTIDYDIIDFQVDPPQGKHIEILYVDWSLKNPNGFEPLKIYIYGDKDKDIGYIQFIYQTGVYRITES